MKLQELLKSELTNLLTYLFVYVFINLSIYYRHDLPEGQLCRYFVYSRADFGVFRPAGATRCTDQDQIWQVGADLRSAPTCQI